MATSAAMLRTLANLVMLSSSQVIVFDTASMMYNKRPISLRQVMDQDIYS
jgi:hypothetical protein